eukprot:404787_1
MDDFTVFYYICILPITICLLLSILVAILLIYKSLSHKNSLSNLYITISIICCIGCLLCLISDTTRLYYCSLLDIFLFDPLITKINTFGDFGYYLGANSFYVIAIIRIHLTFKDTQYAISKKLYLLFVIIMNITILTSIYYIIIVGLMDSVAFFYKYAVPAIIVLMINDCILNTSLMLIFVLKLKKTVLNIESQQIMDFNGKLSTHYRSSKNMIRIITLHLTLFGIAILTNQLFLASLLSGLYFEIM